MAKILLVEDNKENYEVMKRRLERRDYDVVLAVNGEEAVGKAESEEPDLILMDIDLPKIDGLEATRRIRGLSSKDDVPIIALTAHAMAADKDKTREAGCDDHHAKPVSFSQLMRQVETLLDEVQA